MAKVVPTKSGKELKEMGFKLSEKFNRTPQDEEESNFLISQAIESGELSGIELAECYIKSGEMYRDRSRDFEKALSLFSKATEIPGLPSWFAPHNYVEKLATYPEVYGLRKERKNVELAGQMHQINLMLQDGKDLIMTARDLFNDLEKSKARGVGVEYVEIGFDYLKNALESCWEEVWMPVLYTTYGRGYKYHSEKTKENFDHAVSWFQKSIHTKLEDVSPDQLALIASDGSARACFELAELLSNPARFGFDESFKDEHQGEKAFHEGKEKLKKFGSLGVSSIIRRMFLNGWDEKLEYARTEADIPTIMELCRLGRECGQDSDAALYLFEGVVHHHVQRVRSAEDYQRVIGCYYNSLVAFQKLGKGHEWIAKCVAKHATFLALEGLSKKKDYDFEASQKLRTLLGEISQSPEDYNCNDIIKSIIDYYTNQYEESKKPPRFMQRGAMVSTSIKKVLYEKVDLKLQDIQKDMQLYGYYDGFMFTLSQSYTTAQVITSGQVQIDDSPNSVVQLGLKIVSYVPFIGDKITDPLNQILAFMKGADMIQKANNVCTFASNQAAFDSLLQDALIEVINLKKTEILTYEEITEEEQKWYQKVAGFLSKAKLSIERTIYGLRFKTAAQKLGSKHANELIAAWIANGKIYNDKPFLLPDDAKSELIKILTTSEFLAWDDEPEGGGKSQVKEKTEAVSKTLVDFTPTEKKSKCCEIF